MLCFDQMSGDEFFVSESKARDYRHESKQVGAYGIPEAFWT